MRAWQLRTQSDDHLQPETMQRSVAFPSFVVPLCYEMSKWRERHTLAVLFLACYGSLVCHNT